MRIPYCLRLRLALALALLAVGALIAWGASADGPREDGRAGAFDYYVLALSWNASWCAREGDARDAEQCDPKHDFGFTLHGLWPQNEAGWPEYCRTRAQDPARRESDAMADIMGSGGLAWHQWKKHGRCSGLSGPAYYALSRRAYESVARPEIFRRLPRDMALTPAVVEAAFLEANPDMTPDGVTITCQDGYVQEARICLAKDLTPRACAPDTARDCRAPSVKMPKMR
ncbi:ribonuclease T2 [Pikeienuella sp. HZG-20]|uniref:ribonuclease T2 n=1 Tax=Paludibacillus litoralis TaxID=3133267 RepID=UPI0030ED37C8